jgi:hypothetical protein
VQAAIFNVLISNAPSESILLCRSIPGMLALRITLRLQEDKPSTHQKVCECKLMIKGQMDKTQHKNVLTQKYGLACIRK